MEFWVIFLLILLNGVFSMSEIAIVSARKSRLEAAAKRGDKNAKAALETANHPNHFLSTVQIGITLIGILTGIFSGEEITDNLTTRLSRFDSIADFAESIAVGIVVLCITYFSLVIGELVPKRIGLANPEKIAKIVAKPMRVLTIMTSPFVWLLTFSSDLLIKLFRVKAGSENSVTEEEIKAIIQEGTDSGAIQEIEQDIVERVFNLGDRKVSSLMTHRSNVIFIPEDADFSKVRELVNKEMHSVYPVLDKKEQLKGVILLKDLFRHFDQEHFAINKLMVPAGFIAEFTSAYEAVRKFKTEQISYSIVVDEYGVMQGIITLNDMLEALVGDVSDFYGNDFSYVEREDGSILVDGQFPLSELLHRLDLNDLQNQYPFDTISGLILHEKRSVPSPGDRVRWLTYTIEVMDMDGARIDKVLIHRNKE